MATLTIIATEDFRDGTPPIPADVTSIAFNTVAVATPIFAAAQFGPGLIANNLAITGDGENNRIQVMLPANGSFSAALWTFSNWTEDGDDIVTLTGAGGAETITGSSKADSITGGAGADDLSGGGGGDSFHYQLQQAVGGEKINGGAGIDSIRFVGANATNLNSFIGMTITSVETLRFSGTGIQTAIFNASQIGEGGITNIVGEGTADKAILVNGANTDLSALMFTGWNAANETITINGTNTLINQLTGSSQSDIITGVGSSFDLMRGGEGADTLNGGAGIDTADFRDKTAPVVIFLNGVADVVATVGGVAEDILRAIENLLGGSAGDTFVGDGTNNILRGEGGADFLFSHSFNPDGSMKTVAGNDTFEGGAGDDGLFGGDGTDTLNGGDGADGMVGGAGADIMNGDAGGDFLFGGFFTLAGTFAANSGADTLNGGEGNDGLYGFDGADVINADAGDDYVEGGAGNDVMNGGAGSDFLLGKADNDTINGGTGFDYMYGEAGADTFIFRKGDSADWILDFNAAQGDKLRFLDFGYANFAAIPLVDLSTPGNPAVQLTFIENGNVDQLTIFGVTLAQLNAGNALVA